ncbi:MAG: type II toxin-antitoxin system YhaV family toxin [Rhodoluna sp.]|nr:type II toxin-antitoxin system YhaV family toxin [Rhodoluna sp.]
MALVNTWGLRAHPAFLLVLGEYKNRVLESSKKVGKDAHLTHDGKHLKALFALILDTVPSNPADPKFRLGNTLGTEYKHWLRAKFRQQYRVFFRYSSRSQAIVYAWANDDKTLRAYGSKTDAYQVFRKMLESGEVPNDWDELLAESKRLS